MGWYKLKPNVHGLSPGGQIVECLSYKRTNPACFSFLIKISVRKETALGSLYSYDMNAITKNEAWQIRLKKSHDFDEIRTRANALPLSQRVYSLTQLSEIGYKPISYA